MIIILLHSKNLNANKFLFSQSYAIDAWGVNYNVTEQPKLSKQK